MRDLTITSEKNPAEEVLIKMKAACQAVAKGDWQGFRAFFQADPEALFSQLTINDDTALHIAAARADTKLLQDLLGMVENSKILEALTKKRDHHGNTVLHEVATTDSVDKAKLLVTYLRKYVEATRDEKGNDSAERNLGKLLKVQNRLGETPLYRAAALGKLNMVKYLAREIEKESGNLRSHFYRYDDVTILHIAVLAQNFETAVWLLRRGEELALDKENNGLTCLHLLALTPAAFLSTTPMGLWKKLFYSLISVSTELPSLPHDDDDDEEQSKNRSAISKMRYAIWSCLIEGWPIMKKIWEEKRKHKFALELVKLLVKQDTSWDIHYTAEDYTTISLGKGQGGESGGRSTKSTTSSGNSHSAPETPLIMAARTGIIEIVEEILKEYPEAVDHVSPNDQNILQVVIMHRRKEIFELIKKKVISIDALASRIDNNGYTILHHAADMNYYHPTRPGRAFQLQEELKWAEDVKAIMPSHYGIHRNNNNMTAEKLFEEQHQEQLVQAQKWIKDISSSCSTVAVLVASVAFAAAYTVPGGNDPRGRPILLHSSLFSLFAIMDVLSLASSFTSVVMFLCILTSPFELEHFLYSLPRKMTIGFTFLFISVITTMITFTATLLLTLRSLNRHWTAALVYSAAFIPVVVFVMMQVDLYVRFVMILKDFLKKVMDQLAFSLKKKKNKKKRN